MKSKQPDTPPIEETRVREVWERQEARDRSAVRRMAEGRKVSRLRKSDGGKDGTRLASVKIKVSALRTERRIMRCKPGTFEWRYGRDKQGAEFHAGNHLAILWERAGMTIASSSDFLRGISSGYPTGISDGRVAAIDKLNGFRAHVGTAGAERMIDYCVLGLTTAEIARKKNMGQREISTVLHNDLNETAQFLDFVPGKRRVHKHRSGSETV
ncbi:MAG: hypothetical protein KDK08_18310 [Rhizobiaceae bacterium]|nr:hypothetical protein [Rhizobiaceae bacterium]